MFSEILKNYRASQKRDNTEQFSENQSIVRKSQFPEKKSIFPGIWKSLTKFRKKVCILNFY